MSDNTPHHPTSELDLRSDSVGELDRRAARAFDVSSLPRVAAADFAAARRALVRFGPSNRFLKVTLPPFGDLSFTFSILGPTEPPATNDALFRLRRGHECGWLVVDGLGGLRVVAAVLGLPAPRIHRAMSAAERGVLAAVVMSIVRLSPSTVVSRSTRHEWSSAGLARIEVRAASEMVSERCFLDIPASWLPPVADPDYPETTLRRSGLRFPLSLELARTILTAEEWAQAGPGDAVVFDEPSRADRNGAPSGLEAVIGEYAAPLTIVAAGQARLDRPFKTRDREARSAMAQETTRNLNTNMLAAAPIEVVAEIGRLALRADEVMTLEQGSILTFGPTAPTRVDLRIGGQLWATGELVNVDGQLGVRLLRVTPLRDEAGGARESDRP